MKPLCVDLDGTLIKTDLLLESIINSFKKNPLNLYQMFRYGLKSRAHLKSKLSQESDIDINIENLPYSSDVLKFLKEEAPKRDLILTTGSNIRYARLVSQHLGIFKEVLASSDDLNLTGHTKAKLLETKFGIKGFDYIGNSSADVPVWKSADKGISVVNSRWGLSNVEILQTTDQPLDFKKIVKLLRVHQWTKNLLIFIPLLLAHKISMATIITSMITFVSFCFMASAVYILNDVMDVESDRKHPKKRLRPIPAGEISLAQSFMIFFLLFASSLISTLALPTWDLAVFPLGYLTLNILYSTYLKRLLVLDISVLTSFYLIRILFGGAAAGVEVSYWLLSFSFFIFFSLAIIKRYVEVNMLYRLQGRTSAAGRAYEYDDIPILMSIGVSSGIASVIVFSMYIHFGIGNALYSRPKFLWGIGAVILLWICNIWMRAVRGKVDDDPVKFAISDPFSIGVALCIGILGALAV